MDDRPVSTEWSGSTYSACWARPRLQTMNTRRMDGAIGRGIFWYTMFDIFRMNVNNGNSLHLGIRFSIFSESFKISLLRTNSNSACTSASSVLSLPHGASYLLCCLRKSSPFNSRFANPASSASAVSDSESLSSPTRTGRYRSPVRT